MTLDLKAMREKAESIPAGERDWYVVDSPWLPHDAETYVVSRSPDPHAGVQVCDFNDAALAGVDHCFEDEEWSARNWANAAHIAAACPDNVLALLDLLEEAREGLKKLMNECAGLSAFEPGIRVEIGNTNWSCIELRINEARAILAKIDAAMAGGEG